MRWLKKSRLWDELSCIGLRDISGLMILVAILGLVVTGAFMAIGFYDQSAMAAPSVKPTGLRNSDGNIDLPLGRKLVSFGYKGHGFTPWILTRKMRSEEKAETYHFQDDSRVVFTIREHDPDGVKATPPAN